MQAGVLTIGRAGRARKSSAQDQRENSNKSPQKGAEKPQEKAMAENGGLAGAMRKKSGKLLLVRREADHACDRIGH